MDIFKTKRNFLCHSCGTTGSIDFHEQLDFECPKCNYPLINHGALTKICSLYSTDVEYKDSFEQAQFEIMKQLNTGKLKNMHPDDIVYFSIHGKQYENWKIYLDDYNKKFDKDFKSIHAWLTDMRECQLMKLKDAATHTPVTMGGLSKILQIFRIRAPHQITKLRI